MSRESGRPAERDSRDIINYHLYGLALGSILSLPLRIRHGPDE